MCSSDHPFNKNKLTEPFYPNHEPPFAYNCKKGCELGGLDDGNYHFSSEEVLMNRHSPVAYRVPASEMLASSVAYRVPASEMLASSVAYRVPASEILASSVAYRVPASEMLASSVAYRVPATEMLASSVAYRVPATEMHNSIQSLHMPATEMQVSIQSLRMPATEMQVSMQSLRMPNNSAVYLGDSFFSKQKLTEPIYKVDRVLERDIAIGAEWLFNEGTKPDNFYNSIKKIEENKVYNTNIFFNDLQDIDEIKGIRNSFKFFRKILGFGELTNIDSLFDQIQNITPAEVYEYYGDFDFLHEVYHLIDQREQIEYHLKLKALDRFIESTIHEIKNLKQTRSVLSFPLILHLREYLDNIFNIKNIYPLTTLLVIGIINFFDINAYGKTIRDRYIMLSNCS